MKIIYLLLSFIFFRFPIYSTEQISGAFGLRYKVENGSILISDTAPLPINISDNGKYLKSQMQSTHVSFAGTIASKYNLFFIPDTPECAHILKKTYNSNENYLPYKSAEYEKQYDKGFIRGILTYTLPIEKDFLNNWHSFNPLPPPAASSSLSKSIFTIGSVFIGSVILVSIGYFIYKKSTSLKSQKSIKKETNEENSTHKNVQQSTI